PYQHPQPQRGVKGPGHFVAAVPQPPLVAAPPWAQYVLRDELAIEIGLENAMGCGMQGCTGDRPMTFLQAEFRTQQRCAVEVLIRGDRYCRPGERHEFLSVGDHLEWLEPSCDGNVLQ